MKLIEAKEANHIEFARMRNMAEDVVHMASFPELSPVLNLLLEPTVLATGLRIERSQLVDDCKLLASTIGDVLACEGDPDQAISMSPSIPFDFCQDLEVSWRGRVKRERAEEVYKNVDDASAELSVALVTDFLPIVNYVKGNQNPVEGQKGEICHSRENQAVWFKGRNYRPSQLGNRPGETEMKRLIPAFDGKGKKVPGEEWWTTERVENALSNYRSAVNRASEEIVEILRALAEKLKTKMNALIFISVLSVVVKTFNMHVSEGKRRRWVFPLLSPCRDILQLGEVPDPQRVDDVQAPRTMVENVGTDRHMVLVDLVPYWEEPTSTRPQPNTVEMESIFLLTGPNGGGKSTILRSICAAAVMGVCGLMVPAREAFIPKLDAVMLRVMSTDSPADSKSSFQMEMSQLRTILAEATDRSLVLVDELCRGTDGQKGTCLAASVLETLDHIGCLGVLSTHLHDLLDMELQTTKVVHKAMGTKDVDGQVVPTWKLVDSACRESLAFEVARKEGVPESVVQRAEEHYRVLLKRSWNTRTFDLVGNSDSAEEKCKFNQAEQDRTQGRAAEWRDSLEKTNSYREIRDVMEIFNNICKEKLLQIQEAESDKGAFYPHTVACELVGPRQLPPPATTKHSCVYMLQRPDGKFYIGESDALTCRIEKHRLKLPEAPFLYVIVANRSVARELETFLINQLPQLGLSLANKGVQGHRHFGTAPLMEAPPF